MNKLFVIFILTHVFLCVNAQRVKTPNAHSQSFVRFTENKTQWNPKIKYRAQLDGGLMFFEQNGKLTFHLYDKDNYRSRHLGKIISPSLKHHAYSIDFVDANSSPSFVPNNSYEDYANFFIGDKQENWASNVRHYQNIKINELYNGVDALYNGGSQSVKYNFIVHPSGNPSSIKMKYTGVNSIKLKNGELYISTSVSESIEQKPFVYQIINGDTLEIPSKFVLEKNVVSFKLLSDYNHAIDLIIDPLLVFAASSGSTADNFGMTATYDSRGSLYTGGTCFDVGYPTTLGAYDVSFNSIAGYTDVVITKYDSSGVFLRYSTYLGGSSSSEIVTSLIVDKNDNLCLYGATGSSDFPTTVGCYDNTFNGGLPIAFVFNGTTFNSGTDIYVAKLNVTGNTLLASTFIGGSGNDGINYNNVIVSYSSPYGTVTEFPPDSLQYNYGDQYRGEIQIDSLSNIYIYSSTKSSDFPTLNAIDNTLGGQQDAVLVKFNPTLSGLAFSTFIGGSDNDAGYALALDDTLNIYITGGTRSSDFPTTAGSYKPTYGAGKCDGYICKIKSNGSAIMHSSFIGTNNYDQSYFVQLDNQQQVYLYGQSLGNMPVTVGVYSNANSKQFIQKLNPQLNTLLASTVFGNSNGNINISPSAFSVDCAGNIYLSGWGGNIIFLNPTGSMPLTSSAIQSVTDGYNFYLMVLGPNMSSLLFGSYFGGGSSHEHVDGGTSRFDKKGIIYQSVCAGCGSNDDFPVTPGAWPTSLYGSNVNQSTNCNNGVFKVDFELNSAQANISASTLSGCAPLTVTLTNNSTPGHSYLWDFGSNDTTSIIFNPVKTFTAVGTYTTHLYVKTSICTNLYDTATVVINVLPPPISAFTTTSSICSNTVITANNSTGTLSVSPYSWNWGDGSSTSALTSPAHTYTTNGTYTISLSTTALNGCVAKATQTITVFNFTPSVNSSSICLGSTATLTASGGTSYTWQPTTSVSNSVIANPTSTPVINTIYTVQIYNNSPGYTCAQTLTTQVIVNPTIVSNFNYTVIPCTDSVLFINASNTSAPTQTVTWHFGGGQPISTSTNVTQTYTSGTYSITLVAINSFGCKDSVLKPISVFSFSPTIALGGSICVGASTVLTASGGTSYLWSPSSSLSSSITANPIATPTITTSYSVIITNNSPGYTCTKTLTTSVYVYPKITSLFTYSIGACGNNVQFTDVSFASPTNWFWDFGDSNNSIAQNPLHFYTSSGSYTASLIATNSYGCRDTSQQIINLPSFPAISVNASITKCESDSIQLNATGGNYYLWSPAASLSNATIANPLAFPLTTTVYTVTIGAITGIDTCKSNLTTTVSINPFAYNTSSISVSNTTLTLGQSSTVTLNGFTYNGTLTVVPHTNVSVQNDTTVLITPTKSGEYSVYFTEPNGCKHLLKNIYITVLTNECNEGVVYLPTGFTPNNDGANDILYIRSNFITDVYLTIYDRWGEKIFETNDIKIGWNGYYKGKLLDQGVYGYYMTFKCNNGQESFKKGNITLMR